MSVVDAAAHVLKEDRSSKFQVPGHHNQKVWKKRVPGFYLELGTWILELASYRLPVPVRLPRRCNDIRHAGAVQQAGRCQGEFTVALVDAVHDISAQYHD